MLGPARSGISSPTPFGPTAGRAPTPPACRSSPGLVRYDEVAAGVIDHALRFTAPDSCSGHIYPARHDAGSGSCSAKPPMGLRVRLKASVDISGFGTQARVLLTALKKYGMILADNGSPWYVTGAPNSSWNDDVLHALNGIPGSDFEVVDTSGLNAQRRLTARGPEHDRFWAAGGDTRRGTDIRPLTPSWPP